jgi:hypothetical protein
MTRRQYEIRYAMILFLKEINIQMTKTSQTSWYMGYIAETVRRFFHPAAIDEMLATFVPMIDGTSLSVSCYQGDGYVCV